MNRNLTVIYEGKRVDVTTLPSAQYSIRLSDRFNLPTLPYIDGDGKTVAERINSLGAAHPDVWGPNRGNITVEKVKFSHIGAKE